MHPNHRLTVKSTLHRLEKSFMLSCFFFFQTHFHHLCLSLPHPRGEKPTDSRLYHVETNQSSLLGLEGDYLRVRLHNHPQICTVVTYVYRKAIFVLCQVWASFNYKWKANNILRQELILLCPTLSQRFFFPPRKKQNTESRTAASTGFPLSFQNTRGWWLFSCRDFIKPKLLGVHVTSNNPKLTDVKMKRSLYEFASHSPWKW